jgi:hypothetical protein
MFTKMISYEPICGAYTELFAGLSPEITIEQSGAWSMIPNFPESTPIMKTDTISSHPMGSHCTYSKGLRDFCEDYCRGWDRGGREVLALERGASQALPLDDLSNFEY